MRACPHPQQTGARWTAAKPSYEGRANTAKRQGARAVHRNILISKLFRRETNAPWLVLGEVRGRAIEEDHVIRVGVAEHRPHPLVEEIEVEPIRHQEIGPVLQVMAL